QQSVDTSPLEVAINKLAVTITNGLYETGKNYFASSFSISTALAMLYVVSCGSTTDELRTFLNFEFAPDPESVQHLFKALLGGIESDNGTYELDIANAVYISILHSITESYEKMLTDSFYAKCQNLDFQNQPEEAKEIINEF